MDLPEVPKGGNVFSPSEVEAEMDRQLAEYKDSLKDKRISREQYDELLRKLIFMKTTKSDPDSMLLLMREIHHGNPRFPNVSREKIKLPADNRIPLIIPNGHDDSMDKDMRGDVGSWGKDT